jgi:hypothetical protein
MTVDGVGVFKTDMCVSELHSSHGSGRTSSFERCF